MRKWLLICLLVIVSFLTGCSQSDEGNSGNSMEAIENNGRYGKAENPELKKMCRDAGYEWMLMKPTDGGRIMNDAEDCWGCMVENLEHVCSGEKFREMMNGQ